MENVEPVGRDDSEETSNESSISNEVARVLEREKRRLANKPYIDHLDDAVIREGETLKFLPTRGTRVIIERCSTLLPGKPWLDTRVYLVQKIDTTTGALELIDEEVGHFALNNFIQGIKEGFRFKMPEQGKGARQIPKRNKAKPKEKKEAKPEKSVKAASERRVYSTKGIIHTRIKGMAYVPKEQTKAADGMRLPMSVVGTNLKVSFPDGTHETWVPNKDL